MDEPTLDPPLDAGQPGWVRLPDGRRAYRYTGTDELIYEKPTGTEQPPAASNK
ncbi:hypothetical protein GCM10007304_17650 [Rhodococcoides trifolii]|uniref:Uncharacterized protein n=1 Tax=Rhodococcoides trifolii TaxID=908250 RepID=A0A917D0J7_9NOCA|nr:hypothetical protein [Rhodococcus trifolii]GGG03987.1 hypothetical protein GCM10007304_17650 [Rhodococcus trifolii]